MPSYSLPSIYWGQGFPLSADLANHSTALAGMLCDPHSSFALICKLSFSPPPCQHKKRPCSREHGQRWNDLPSGLPYGGECPCSHRYSVEGHVDSSAQIPCRTEPGQPHPGEIVLLLLLRKKSKNRKVWNYKLFVNAERAVSSCPSRILSRTKNFGYGCHVPEFLSQRSRKAAAPALGQPEWIAEKSISYAAGRFRRVRWKISPTNRPTAAGQIQPNPSSKKGR